MTKNCELESFTSVELGELNEITDLRSVWKDEGRNFTPWLAQEVNITRLSNTLGLNGITNIETESSVGSFNADIYAKEIDSDRTIIIENQLEETNHDHLGKLLTYASGKKASIIIWIVKHARPEHRAAIEWLNENTGNSIGFFLCEIKLYQIGESLMAPSFEIIEQPNEWGRIQNCKNLKQIEKEWFDFWNTWNEYSSQNDKFKQAGFQKRMIYPRSWLTYPVGSASCHLEIVQIRKTNEIVVQLYFPDDKEYFNKLLENKEGFNADAGCELEWVLNENNKNTIIRLKRNINYDEVNNELFDWCIDALIRMKKTFNKFKRQ